MTTFGPQKTMSEFSFRHENYVISNLFVFKNEYVIRISINDTGFYAGSFKFKMDNYKLYDIAMDDYYGNFQHPGTKSLFLKYPMIKIKK